MDATQQLKALVTGGSPDPDGIARLLDGLGTPDAIDAVRALSGRRHQRPLWNAVAANPPISVSDMVPVDYKPMKPVRFHGKNSLPAFTQFEKICCRPPQGDDGDVLWGYNETSIRPLIGPGYFVVHDTRDNPFGGAAFDYTRLPVDHPGQWPQIRPNEAGLSRFIYNGTIDYMRRVSRDVFIGAATRAERSMDSYFILVRDPL